MALKFQFTPVAAAVLLAAPCLSAQTLQQRPQPAPQPPAAPAPQHSVPAKPVLPTGTSMQVEILNHYAMRAGIPIEARLVYPLYVGGKLAVPENTPVHGTVTELEPDKKERAQARLMGDFTPFHTARVQFDQLILPEGPVPLRTTGTTTGAPVLRLASSGALPKKSMIGRYWDQAKQRLHDQMAFFAAPGLGDRAKQMLYRQLPYHPERIDAHTAWTFELSAPLALAGLAADPPDPPAPAPPPGKPEIWSVRALLTGEVSSATAKPGDPIRALVVEPVLDKDHQLVVPQGSILIGHVTTAQAARSLGRNGKLRFNFQQVQFPAGTEADRPVQGTLAGATSQGSQKLNLDAEGTVTPRNQSSVIAPLLLTMLAGRALDQDGNLTAGTAVASNGFGIVGRVVGIAAGSRELATGLGYYAAALSTYRNFLRTGRDVIFPKDTRIEIETTPLRAPVLKPDASSTGR